MSPFCVWFLAEVAHWVTVSEKRKEGTRTADSGVKLTVLFFLFLCPVNERATDFMEPHAGTVTEAALRDLEAFFNSLLPANVFSCLQFCC